MEFTIRVGKRSFIAEPINSLKAVDFAIGVLNDKAYLGYWQDFAFKDETGDLLNVDRLPVLVFEDEIVPYTPEQLKEKGVRRSTIPIEMDNWWSRRFVDIDPVKYYNEVFEQFAYYVDNTEQNLHYLTLWTIGTGCHNLFQAYPYLHLFGPKRSGKTKTLTLIKCLGFNGIRSHSLSAAAIYRLVESGHTTLLLDEQDYLANPDRKEDFRVLLYGGYKQGSYVVRNEKLSSGKIVPAKFTIYSPKALANIEGLEDVLQDRAITIIMPRSVDPNITRREPDEEDPMWLEKRNELASLYIKHWKEIREAYSVTLKALGDVEDYSSLPDGLKPLFKEARNYLYSRAREIWAPIVALALFFESKGVKNLVEKILSLAKENIHERTIDEIETPEVGLIYALKKVYYVDGYYALPDIYDAFKKETGIERIDVRSIGRMLKRLGVKNKRRVSGTIQYLITDKIIKDLARRFSIDLEQKTDISAKTAQSEQTAQTVLLKAQAYCQAKGSFTTREVAEALKVSEEEAKKLLKLFEEEKRVVRFGDTYSWVKT